MTARTNRPSAGFYFPGGHRFAFSIFDDTDVGTLASVRPLYDFLAEIGLRTTKTVWPLRYAGDSAFAGSHTLEDTEYAAYLKGLAEKGFELAFHGATMESSTREDTERALNLFRETFGFYPRSYAGHAANRENLYWGAARFKSRLLRRLYSALSREPADRYQGHVEKTEWFWGDLSLRHLTYVRGFTFDSIDLWKVTPHVCYQDAGTPWVRYWFISADADNVEEFVQVLSEANQERLVDQGGLCLLSSHLGKGFVRDGSVDPRVRRLLSLLAERDGWFAPVSDILDFLRVSGQVQRISAAERFRLETRWFLHALRRRVARKSYHKTELPYLSGNERTDLRAP
jgi:hypothetical protein